MKPVQVLHLMAFTKVDTRKVVKECYLTPIQLLFGIGFPRVMENARTINFVAILTNMNNGR